MFKFTLQIFGCPLPVLPDFATLPLMKTVHFLAGKDYLVIDWLKAFDSKPDILGYLLWFLS